MIVEHFYFTDTGLSCPMGHTKGRRDKWSCSTMKKKDLFGSDQRVGNISQGFLAESIICNCKQQGDCCTEGEFELVMKTEHPLKLDLEIILRSE